ncbi:ribosomal-protein-alanine acetyltransferase [Paraferrimonas sedimenticola]|uniref:[Ribosomal protein bS18]-alanine N-acetyltransferase n=2 Tax=Paraferrimonas sedimenticola TaxID=375674 RepID=A0AA37W2R5_9GAMM|nr:ribosomal-protein-alanine acetyltransferase [Paraferrimonas sedimenticola]
MADLDAITAIEQTAHLAPWGDSSLQACFDEHHDFVGLFEGAKLQGYFVSHYVLDEASLLNICVAPNAQGKGLGNQLMQQVIAAAKRRQCASLFLEVRASNLAANKLYLRHGFVELAIRKGYYPGVDGSPREDARVMQLLLA